MGCCCSSENDKKLTQKSPSERKSENSFLMPKGRAQYTALWDYKAGSNSELNLTKGEVLQGEYDMGMGPEWVLVSKPGKGTGYVPRSWLAEVGTLEVENWYFPEMKREQAEKILGGMPDGTYMVRGRKTRDGVTFAVSVAQNNTAKHYRVKTIQEKDGTVKYYMAKAKFVSIPEMIAFFQRSAANICCKLDSPAPKYEPERIELPADVQKNWREIPRKQIEIVGDVLGKGNFGFVRKGIWKPTETISLEVAVKELKKGMSNAREDFLKEAVAMKNLVHERLVKLHGIVSADEPYWIVTEFVKDGSLKKYLKARDARQEWLPEPKLVEMAIQIADGMRYLESKNVVHRDLAARNVLVDERPGEWIKETIINMKIADFGMATMMKGRKVKEVKSMELAVKWTAPEALKELRFSTASDVWSFGILMHELFTHGQDPYKGKTAKQVRDELLKTQSFSLERAEGVPDKIYDLMVACCHISWRNRLSFQDIFDGLEKFYDKGVDPYERYRQ